LAGGDALPLWLRRDAGHEPVDRRTPLLALFDGQTRRDLARAFRLAQDRLQIPFLAAARKNYLVLTAVRPDISVGGMAAEAPLLKLQSLQIHDRPRVIGAGGRT
jgi:hypothetical protein